MTMAAIRMSAFDVL